ncbi:MAG: hypothetical protein QXM92_03205 [Candidatus Anstonellales archaeon]
MALDSNNNNSNSNNNNSNKNYRIEVDILEYTDLARVVYAVRIKKYCDDDAAGTTTSEGVKAKPAMVLIDEQAFSSNFLYKFLTKVLDLKEVERRGKSTRYPVKTSFAADGVDEVTAKAVRFVIKHSAIAKYIVDLTKQRREDILDDIITYMTFVYEGREE